MPKFNRDQIASLSAYADAITKVRELRASLDGARVNLTNGKYQIGVVKDAKSEIGAIFETTLRGALIDCLDEAENLLRKNSGIVD